MQNVSSLIREHRNKYSEGKIRALARTDALNSIPSCEGNAPAPFEMELVHSYKLLASKISVDYQCELEKLDAYIKTSEEHATRDYENQIAHADRSQKAKLLALEKDTSVTNAKKTLNEAEVRFQNIYSRVGRLPIEYMPHWLYMIFASLIFIGEIPLNALVFQIFGENQVMTWVMAFIIGLSVPLFSHFIGIKFREHDGEISWPNLAKGTIALAVICVALYGLSVMRTTYLGEFKEDLGITQAIVQSSMLFYYLNVAVLAAAIIIAYLSHDPISGYQKSYREFCKAKKDLEKAENALEASRRQIDMETVAAQNQAAADRCRTLDQVALAKGQYDKTLREGQEEEASCLHRLGRDIAIYRRENLLNRKDGKKPTCFDNELDFVLRMATMKEKIINEMLH